MDWRNYESKIRERAVRRGKLHCRINRIFLVLMLAITMLSLIAQLWWSVSLGAVIVAVSILIEHQCRREGWLP
jgi:membrane protein YdbS with pleckstrin-like domain